MKQKLTFFIKYIIWRNFFKGFLFSNLFLTLQIWHILVQIVFFSSLKKGTFTLFKLFVRLFPTLFSGHFDFEILARSGYLFLIFKFFGIIDINNYRMFRFKKENYSAPIFEDDIKPYVKPGSAQNGIESIAWKAKHSGSIVIDNDKDSKSNT